MVLILRAKRGNKVLRSEATNGSYSPSEARKQGSEERSDEWFLFSAKRLTAVSPAPVGAGGKDFQKFLLGRRKSVYLSDNILKKLLSVAKVTHELF